VRLLQVEARGLKPNTKFFYQFRYRQNGKAAPVRAAAHLADQQLTVDTRLLKGLQAACHWRVDSSSVYHVSLSSNLPVFDDVRCTQTLAAPAPSRAPMTTSPAGALLSLAAPTWCA
jgi:hypothetical protein